jgi:hypothetical protein
MDSGGKYMALSSDFEVIVPGKKAGKLAPVPQSRIASQPQPQTSQEPSFLSQAAGSLGNLGLSALQGAAQIPAGLLDLGVSLGQTFAPPTVSETGQITQAQRLSPEQRAELALTPKVEAVAGDIRKKLPQSLEFPGEKFINKIAQALPAFYLPGGGFTNAVARAIGSESGKGIANQAGLGELGQFFGSTLGAGLASGLLSHRNLKNLESANYRDFEKSINPKAEAKLQLSQESYNNILKNPDLDPDASEWLAKNLKFIEPAIKSGTEKVKTSFDKLLKINKIIRDKAKYIKEPAVRTEVVKSLQDISSNLKQDIVNSAADNPGLYVQGLINGSSISYARNNPSLIRRIIKQVSSKGGALSAAAVGVSGTPLVPLAAQALTGKIGLPLAAAGLGSYGFVEPALMALQSPAVREELLSRTIPQTLFGVLSNQQ